LHLSIAAATWRAWLGESGCGWAYAAEGCLWKLDNKEAMHRTIAIGFVSNGGF
jgi:hypothetical protein